MSSSSVSASPLPKSKSELEFFRKARKRWQDSPRTKLVSLESITSPTTKPPHSTPADPVVENPVRPVDPTPAPVPVQVDPPKQISTESKPLVVAPAPVTLLKDKASSKPFSFGKAAEKAPDSSVSDKPPAPNPFASVRLVKDKDSSKHVSFSLGKAAEKAPVFSVSNSQEESVGRSAAQSFADKDDNLSDERKIFPMNKKTESTAPANPFASVKLANDPTSTKPASFSFRKVSEKTSDSSASDNAPAPNPFASIKLLADAGSSKPVNNSFGKVAEKTTATNSFASVKQMKEQMKDADSSTPASFSFGKVSKKTSDSSVSGSLDEELKATVLKKPDLSSGAPAKLDTSAKTSPGKAARSPTRSTLSPLPEGKTCFLELDNNERVEVQLDTLANFKGKEKELFRKLEEEHVSPSKTGIVPTADKDSSEGSGNQGSASDTSSSYRDRLIQFYEKHNPSKVNSVDDTLVKFKGREEELFRKLEAKYVTGKNGILPPMGEGPTCFLEFQYGENDKKGRIEVKLFQDKTPLACENFRALCTGEKGVGRGGKPLTYLHSRMHRIVPNFCIQGGDFTKGDGTGGESIYAPGSEHGDMWGKFKDELFMAHSRKGLLSMANNGPNRNGSQFFVTLKPVPYLDGKHVVFGEVSSGMDVMEEISSIPTNKKQQPLSSVTISNCGEVRDGSDVRARDESKDTANTPFNVSVSSGTFGANTPFSFGATVATKSIFGTTAALKTTSVDQNAQDKTNTPFSLGTAGLNTASDQNKTNTGFGSVATIKPIFGASSAQTTPTADQSPTDKTATFSFGTAATDKPKAAPSTSLAYPPMSTKAPVPFGSEKKKGTPESPSAFPPIDTLGSTVQKTSSEIESTENKTVPSGFASCGPPMQSLFASSFPASTSGKPEPLSHTSPTETFLADGLKAKVDGDPLSASNVKSVQLKERNTNEPIPFATLSSTESVSSIKEKSAPTNPFASVKLVNDSAFSKPVSFSFGKAPERAAMSSASEKAVAPNPFASVKLVNNADLSKPSSFSVEKATETARLSSATSSQGEDISSNEAKTEMGVSMGTSVMKKHEKLPDERQIVSASKEKTVDLVDNAASLKPAVEKESDPSASSATEVPNAKSLIKALASSNPADWTEKAPVFKDSTATKAPTTESQVTDSAPSKPVNFSFGKATEKETEQSISSTMEASAAKCPLKIPFNNAPVKTDTDAKETSAAKSPLRFSYSSSAKFNADAKETGAFTTASAANPFGTFLPETPKKSIFDSFGETSSPFKFGSSKKEKPKFAFQPPKQSTKSGFNFAKPTKPFGASLPEASNTSSIFDSFGETPYKFGSSKEKNEFTFQPPKDSTSGFSFKKP